MLSAKRLVGLPVVSLADGREIGRVKHVLLDTTCSRVLGLAVDTGRWWRGWPVLPVEKAVGIGGEAVTVPGPDALSAVEAGSDLERAAEAEYALIGRLVLSREGASAGKVSDYGFDLDGGRITSLAVLREGPAEGRDPLVVCAQQVIVYGRDAVVVSGLERPATGEPAEQDPRPTGAHPEAEAAAHEAADRQAVPFTAREQEGSPGSTPVEAPGGSLRAGELARLFQERQERFLLGKVAQRAVRDEQGGTVVAAGEIVTPELLAKVKGAGRLLDLTASVSLRA